MSSETTEITWNNGQGSRNRKGWMLLVKGNAIHAFIGQNIPGVVAIRGSDHNKNGKWSSTTYRLTLAPHVVAIAGMDGWETGSFREGLGASKDRGGREGGDGVRTPRIDTWLNLATALRVTVPAAMKFLREWRPSAAEHFDSIDAALDQVDEAAGDQGVEEIAISFGGPTRAQRNDGFWDWPVVVYAADDTVLDSLAAPDYTPTSARVKVLANERSGGHGGGYASLRLVVPTGCKAFHSRPQKSDDTNTSDGQWGKPREEEAPVLAVTPKSNSLTHSPFAGLKL